jgi:hypothetical protein
LAGGVASAYRDGALVSTHAFMVGAGFDDLSLPLVAGTASGDTSELVLWNTALTAVEVASLYQRQNTYFSSDLLQPAGVQPASLLGYWRFGGAPGLVNGSILPATVGPSAQAQDDGGMMYAPGGLQSGGGNNYFSVPAAQVKTLGEGPAGPAMTVSFWFRSTDMPPNYTNLFTHTNWTNAGWSILLSNASTTPEIGLRLDTTAKKAQYVGTVTKVFDKHWHQVAFAIDPQNVTAYRDGVQIGKAGYVAGAGIGVSNADLDGALGPGNYGDVAIWGSTLSAADVAKLYSLQGMRYSILQ